MKEDTKYHMSYDPLYTKYPEWAKLQTQQVSSYQRLDKGAASGIMLIDVEFSIV